MSKVILIVLDSAGVGALPDAGDFDDIGSDTIGHIAETTELKLPNMCSMGLGRIVQQLQYSEHLSGAYGKAAEYSKGKDTTTGHWEIAGLKLENPFPTFPNGFPEDFIRAFSEKIGVDVIGNYASSGTKILEELGEEHIRTGKPIVYTSADSVFQIAAHEDIIPVEKLYSICQTARKMLQGELGVGRVIARPFIGDSEHGFTRTAGRKDFSLPPFRNTLLDLLKQSGKDVLAVGKIEDIFALQGITESIHSAGNPACMDATYRFLEKPFNGLLFVNLVDFDMVYGHRRDPEGYAKALMEFDKEIPKIKKMMDEEDLLIITADHGCDPTFKGTDHTREYIPILCWSPKIKTDIDLGIRNTYADIAKTICEFCDIDSEIEAESFCHLLKKG